MAKMFKEIKNKIITMSKLTRMTRQIYKRKIEYIKTYKCVYIYLYLYLCIGVCVCINLLKQKIQWMSRIVYCTQVKKKKLVN